MSVILRPDFPAPPKFAQTSCSQCGGSFGPGNSGYSHCDQHSPPRIPVSGANERDIERTRQRLELAKGLFASLVKAHVENLVENLPTGSARRLSRELRLFLDGLDDLHKDLAGSIHAGLVE